MTKTIELNNTCCENIDIVLNNQNLHINNCTGVILIENCTINSLLIIDSSITIQLHNVIIFELYINNSYCKLNNLLHLYDVELYNSCLGLPFKTLYTCKKNINSIIYCED